MKKFLKIILQYYLKIITKIVLLVHRPIIIAVAGSNNKSFFRDEIKKILIEKGKIVRANPKNFNTEIGLPLAILNVESGYNSYRRWLPAIWNSLGAVFQKDFPDYLVLELGVSQKGDMKYLLSIVRPKIVVITGITQRYIESFSGIQRLIGEYVYLVKNIQRDGVVFLNWNNEQVRNLKRYSKAKVLYFGVESSDCDGEILSIGEEIWGMQVKMRIGNKEKEVKIKRFGEHHALSSLVSHMIEEEI